jgi:hypothetical protein
MRIKKLTLLFCGCVFLLACQSNGKEKKNETDAVAFPDGSYCADADYFNPNTRYKSAYRVQVEVKNMEVILVYFSGGRVIGEPSFRRAEVAKGRAEIVTDLGVEFKFRNLRSESECYIDPQPDDLFEKKTAAVYESPNATLTVPTFVVFYAEGTSTEAVTASYRPDPSTLPVIETGVVPAPVEAPTYLRDPHLSTIPFRRGELVSMNVTLDLPGKQISGASLFDIDERMRSFRSSIELPGKPGKTVSIEKIDHRIFYEKAKADSFYAKVSLPITKRELLRAMGVNTDFLND